MAASWRFCLLISISLLITAGPGIALIAAMLGPSAGVPLGLAMALLTVSVLTHEFGHALLAVSFYNSSRRASDLAAAYDDDIQPKSGWLSAALIRPTLSRRQDVAVTLSGPLAGASVGLVPVVVSALVFGVVSPISAAASALFGFHLLALSPLSKDGIALRDALVHRESFS